MGAAHRAAFSNKGGTLFPRLTHGRISLRFPMSQARRGGLQLRADMADRQLSEPKEGAGGAPARSGRLSRSHVSKDLAQRAVRAYLGFIWHRNTTLVARLKAARWRFTGRRGGIYTIG